MVGMAQALDDNFQVLQRALADRYELDCELGRGGMGRVYLARELQLDRPVALKVLLPERAMDPGARERFVREARIAARLSHPHVIPIFSVEELEAVVFYAMAYIEGYTVEQRIRSAGRLAPAEVVRLLRETAWGLAYAHARGVIHRDIKPDNILIERETHRVLVTDFGIARLGTTGSTGPVLLGTPEFISPEQVSGKAADARSDIYALGVVGYYALTGRLPFDGPDETANLSKHVCTPVPTLAREAPWVPRHLARVIERCLHKDPDARYQSGEALVEALAQLEHPLTAPLAVRAFFMASRQLSGPSLLYGAIMGGGLAPLLLEWTTQPMLRLRLAAVGLLAPLGCMAWRVRRLIEAGYDRDDLVGAIASDLARRREELAFTYGTAPSKLETRLRLAAGGAVEGGRAPA